VDEVTQPLFGRLADVNDWVYDLIGGGIGLAAGFAASRWLARD
jgi:VanZ family protein